MLRQHHVLATDNPELGRLVHREGELPLLRRGRVLHPLGVEARSDAGAGLVVEQTAELLERLTLTRATLSALLGGLELLLGEAHAAGIPLIGEASGASDVAVGAIAVIATVRATVVSSLGGLIATIELSPLLAGVVVRHALLGAERLRALRDGGGTSHKNSFVVVNVDLV